MKQRQHAGVGGTLFHATVGWKWCAGPKIDHAMRAIEKDFASGKGSLVNYLGEHCTTKEEVAHNMAAYEALVDTLATRFAQHRSLDPTFCPAISIKPTQFGLDVVEIASPSEYARANMASIVDRAAKADIPVWLDMEDHRTTDFTLNLYRSLLEQHGPAVRAVLQANLKRTQDDLRDLMVRDAAIVRLVKGIYQENPEVAFMTNEDIHQAFSQLIRVAFEESPRGFGLAIGSHHSGRIREAVDLQVQYHKDYFVVQVLRGVMAKLADQLVAQGVTVETYQPYGPNEFPYSVRRMRESPNMMLGLVRAAFFEGRYTRLYEHH